MPAFQRQLEKTRSCDSAEGSCTAEDNQKKVVCFALIKRQHLQNQGNPRYIFPPNPPSQNPRGCLGEMYIVIASDSPSTARKTRQGKRRWESGFATPQGGVLQRGRRKVQSKMQKVQLHYCRNQEKAVPLHPANPDKPYGENLRRVSPSEGSGASTNHVMVYRPTF